MMTRELEVSILAAPLAAMDRRALSQAWYSALHLAQRSPQGESAVARPAHLAVLRPQAMRSSSSAADCNVRAAYLQPVARQSASRSSCDASPGGASSIARGRSLLSQRIERRFAVTAQPTARATFSFGRGTARVHVIMQTNGNTARLVAICRPAMREVVARALAEARLALRARGIYVAGRGRECF